MDISTFFKFPGILIIIGVFLLIISIILMITAYKTEKKSTNESTIKNESINEINNINIDEKEEKEEQEETKETTKDEELSKTKVYKHIPKIVQKEKDEHEEKERPQNIIKEPEEFIRAKKAIKQETTKDTIDVFDEEFNNSKEEDKTEEIELL